MALTTCFSLCRRKIDENPKEEEDEKKTEEDYTLDGTLNSNGQPALRRKTGRWDAAILILVNQALATLAFFGVGVNLVLFLTRVMGDNNADAANKVSKWTGTVYLFSLLGAFLSDSYWGRYTTCAVFQIIFVSGLALLSLATHLFLLKPRGCGTEIYPCKPHSEYHIIVFYFSIYLVALGNGGYQPNIATFGADQFDEEDQYEGHSKIAFFSYFYLSLNLGSLFSNTILVYFEDNGLWPIGFWAATASASVALLLFLFGTPKYRHFKPNGNPLSRFFQVLVVSSRKAWDPSSHSNTFKDCVYEKDQKESSPGLSARKLLRTPGFKFLDRAAELGAENYNESGRVVHNPWRICTTTQVEEVKCILRLLPIWLCTILFSVVFTQMASIFVEQGATMKTEVLGFPIPPASMSSFDVLSVIFFIYIYRRVISPVFSRLKGPRGITELQRMGVGLVISVVAMVTSGVVETFRLRRAEKECPNCEGSSSLSILWQIPQYALIGASEVFMYVGQLEFFNAQAPDGLKSFGSALCMTSISVGNYVSILLVTMVMKISTEHRMPGWIPRNLNRGHLDRFFFLLAALTAADFVIYLVFARWYKSIKFKDSSGGGGSCNAMFEEGGVNHDHHSLP